jgi:hypothetical protein
MAVKKENRGGSRPGAGRPKKIRNYSERVKRNYIQAEKFFSDLMLGKNPKMRKLTQEHIVYGWTLGLVYCPQQQKWVSAPIQDTVRVSAAKMRQDAFIVKETYHTEDRTERHVQFYLPETKEKPQEAIDFEKQFRGTTH